LCNRLVNTWWIICGGCIHACLFYSYQPDNKWNNNNKLHCCVSIFCATAW
jgi:hypothetical protein